MKSPRVSANVIDPADRMQTLLVQEFRACQRVLQLLQEEQRALLHGNTRQLLSQAGAVSAALEALQCVRLARTGLTDARRKKPLGIHAAGIHVAGMNTASKPGDFDILMEGVHALHGSISILLHSNIALARSALERIQAAQSDFTWSGGQTDPLAVFAALLDARRALESGDHGALAGALDELQGLIAQPHSPQSPAADYPARGGGLFEKLAILHHQQNAYQAVYQSRQRLMSMGN